MENFGVESYRDKLAAELKATPKNMRRALLDEARRSAEYMEAFWEHNKPRWDKRQLIREQRIKDLEPDIDFNLNDIEDLKQKLNQLAEYIYSTTIAYDHKGGYDPQKGHMLCGEITDRFIAYLKSRGIESRRISRTYEIENPDGEYDEGFNHVYLIINGLEDHTLVDPTYLQWISAEERQGYPSVLVMRFKDEQDFRVQFNELPIKEKMVLPFYLGFDSNEAREYFKNSKYTVISEERARLEN